MDVTPMLKDCQTVWKNCLEIIAAEIPEQSFQTWFRPIKPVKLLNNILTLEVPSPFFYEWLEEYYVDLLRKALVAELGTEGKLEYSIVVDKGKPQHEPLMLRVRAIPQKSVVPVARPVSGFAPHPMRQEAPQNPQNQPHQPQETGNNTPFLVPEVAPILRESQLNTNYIFNTYIEGDCNRLARAAGLAIAQRPGTTSFNPLVIYGGVGLGKTHLVQAIGNEIKRNHPDKFVLYVTTEQFTAQFIDALKNNNVQQFTNFYLQVDVLIVDDIQFLAQKEKTQENFFHIFNRLHQSGRQIIMTSDCPPRSLNGMQERLLSRFKWGLTTDIQKPDFETRVAIVQTKLENEGVNVPEDVIEYIAYNVDSNIRELEGVLISLIANASLMRKDIDLSLAKTTLLNIVRNSEKLITIDYIMQIVADYFGISVEDLKSKTRKREVANARQIAMYFSQQYTKLPLKTIGESFGGRDHSTVVHASKAVSKRSDEDAAYNKIIEDLVDQMQIKK